MAATLALPASAAPLARVAWQLDLPVRSPKKPPTEVAPPPPQGDLAPKGAAAALQLPSAPAPAPLATLPPVPMKPADSARALFGDLARARELRIAEPALERLLALGPEMLPVARAELASAHAPTLLAAGRACLIGGTLAEREAVAERLTRALPPECAGPLLDELLARDPTLATPEVLCGLLDHPTPAMRVAAVRALEPRLTSAHLVALEPLFSSTRTAARSAALELVARVGDPLAWNLVASRLGDANAQLALRAAELLATSADAEALLLERAFPAADPAESENWERARAYALLALVQREDAYQRQLLTADEARID
jgi:hypothetical protein